MNNENRIKVFIQTLTIAFQKFYSDRKGNIVQLPSIVGDSFFYNKEIKSLKSKEHEQEDIIVENEDSLVLAKKLLDNGLKPAVLNMASNFMPGGSVLKGSGAQEENLFRRTNLFQSLYRYHNIGSEFDIERDEKHSYPLNDNYGGIYSKNVVVFRNTESENYDFLSKPFLIDVISVAAIRKPKYNKNLELSEEDIIKEKNKIRTIFNIALKHGNDSLVLGAFGCGAFKTPPKAMAKCFHEVINEKEYKNKFKVIAFAIINSNSNYKEHNPEGNFKPFKEEFS